MYKNKEKLFNNPFKTDNRGILIINDKDKYASNFAKQWKEYNYVQIDSKNNFNISEKFLEDLIFDSLDFLHNKEVLEIGCGAGRFTEHIVKKSKLCVSVDLSSAIYHNVVKNNDNLILVKADFLELIPLKKFDIVICRGVLQHTPDPLKSIDLLFILVISCIPA